MTTVLEKIEERMKENCPEHVFPVISREIKDGDTVKTILDLSFYTSNTASCRVAGVDTPEKKTAAGQAVKAAVIAWFDEIPPDDLKCISLARDKFGGRFLGTFFARNKAQTLSHWLLSHGLARPYEGGKKAEWTQQELDTIEQRANGLIPPTPALKVFQPGDPELN